MAKTVIVKLTDDIDGGDADETVHFALDGRTYEIDLSTANALTLREAFKPFIEKGRPSSGVPSASRGRVPSERSGSYPKTACIRSSAAMRRRASVPGPNMPTARRISDARVKSWIAAGKP